MAAISNKQEFIDYVYRKLGFPVVEINVTEEQTEDIIHDGLKFMQEFHEDFYERTYVKHVVTASHILLSTNSAEFFKKGEKVVGQTSGASLVVFDNKDNKLRALTINGEFEAGESVIGEQSNFTTSLALTDFQFIGDTQNRYIKAEDDTLEVLRVLPLRIMYNQSDYIFDIKYQFAVTDLYNLNNSSLTYYHMVQDHLALLDFEFNNLPSVSFKRAVGKIMLNVKWGDTVIPDQVIVFEVFRKLNPDIYGKLYDDKMFKKLIVAMLKYQWGQNLSKYDGIKLPGGITMNGVQMKAEAAAEVAQIQEEIRETYEGPPEFIVG